MTGYLLKNGYVFTDGNLVRSDLLVDGDTVRFVTPSFSEGLSVSSFDISEIFASAFSLKSFWYVDNSQ